MQDAGEQHTEPYSEYGEGVAEPGTSQSHAKSVNGDGSAVDELGLTVTVLPLYHPAAALYNGGQRQTLMDDFSLIPAILQKIRKENFRK